MKLEALDNYLSEVINLAREEYKTGKDQLFYDGEAHMSFLAQHIFMTL